MIDLINGVEAVTEELCDKEKILVDENKILNNSISIEDAKKTALIYIRHIIIQKIKVLKIPSFTN